MKNIYLILVTICSYFAAYTQAPATETVGNPDSSIPVNSYIDWSNQGIINYTGSAEVENINPSTGVGASGGGNIFFNDTVGTFFQMINFPSVEQQPATISIYFYMYGYDTAKPDKLDELTLSVSTDSGLTWSALPYQRFWHLFPLVHPPQPWDLFETSFKGTDVSKLAFRFTQNTTNKTFRIDDISLEYAYLLSVKLEYFTVNAINQKAIINWHVNSQSNKELFVLEKSENGEQFSPITQQYAKGVGEYSYEYVDKIGKLKLFYRLKMIDAEGKILYSKIIMINPELNSTDLIKMIYPIPAKDVLNVQINNLGNQKINLLVTNAKGQFKMKRSLLLNEGTSNIELNIQNWEPGVYYLSIITLNNTQTKKIVVVK